MTGKRTKSEDHKRAAVELEKLCKATTVTDTKGVHHLSWLLGWKTDVAYGEKPWTGPFCWPRGIKRSAFKHGPTITSKGCFVAEVSSRILEGRGKNAVAQFLSEKLVVPKIFFDARWPGRTTHVDVLAVDRSGAGDVHAVEIKVGKHHLATTLRDLIRIPAQFKYLAYFDRSGEKGLINPDSEPEDRLYAPDGMGRIGTICLYQEGP